TASPAATTEAIVVLLVARRLNRWRATGTIGWRAKRPSLSLRRQLCRRSGSACPVSHSIA
ncbi:hypothetical protein LTR33_013416, partial [Friedmanniomyces endolithicus]